MNCHLTSKDTVPVIYLQHQRAEVHRWKNLTVDPASSIFPAMSMNEAQRLAVLTEVSSVSPNKYFLSALKLVVSYCHPVFNIV
jgi:hypothetical protein